ncbi:MAG: hypothetical protein ACOYD7_04790 [Raoultibacter sp.]
MINTLHASTLEIDDPSEAVEDILSQLDFSSLQTNSIGWPAPIFCTNQNVSF